MKTPLIRFALLALVMPGSAMAASFFTDFEGQNVRTAQSFTINDGSLSATFDGGTAFTIGDAALYRSGTVSWMLDPAGTNSRGTSTGEGEVTLSEPAISVDGYVRTENASTVARMQVIDATGAVVAEVTANNTGWTRVNHGITGGEAEITRLRFINDGGGMGAFEDFGFTTEDGGGGNTGGGGSGGGNSGGGMGGGGGSGAPGIFLLLLPLLRRRR